MRSRQPRAEAEPEEELTTSGAPAPAPQAEAEPEEESTTSGAPAPAPQAEPEPGSHLASDAAPAPDLAGLARATRDGDQAAFRGLIDATYDRLYRLAVSLLRDPDEADDVVQETYIRAWDRRADLREPDRVVPYLARITRNAARDRLRWWTRWRGPGGPGGGRELVVADAAAPVDQRLAEAQLGADIARGLAALADKHRAVLLLREVEDMTYEEMAELLGVPVGTVESRLHRARAQLARRLRRLAPGAGEEES